jgi:proton-translocating NADH-quinone oxidoreductase chain N
MPSSIFLWVIGLPLLSTPINYLVGCIGRENRSERTASPSRWFALAALLAACIPFYQAVRLVSQQGSIAYTLSGINLRMDGLSLVLSGTALMLAILVVIFSGPYMAGEDGEEKYYALLTGMTGAMIGLSAANDLFNLWVWFELMAIASYALVGFYRTSPMALEAGVKYLVQSAAGSVLVLLGIALVFMQSGTLAFDQIRLQNAASDPLLLAAGALFLIGFGVKAALVPLHTWLPDAHSQAPSGISAMLSGVVIEAGLLALLRALGALAGVTASWATLILAFGAVNMLAGNLLALRQTQVKRLLAFSSLAHMGYMLLGLGTAVLYQSEMAAQGAFFHLLNHGMMKGLAFLAAGVLLWAFYAGRGSHQPLSVSDLNGASRRYPLASLALGVAVLALGGLPPFSGFMSKWQIFAGSFLTGDAVIQVLVIFAALNSVLSLGYYAPLVNRLYRHEPSQAVLNGLPVGAGFGIPLVLLAAGVIALGIWPNLAAWLTVPASKALLAMFGI